MTFAAALVIFNTASAQSVTHPADTIRGMEITYYYQDWIDTGTNCRPLVDVSSQKEIARYFYTDTAITIIGAAVSLVKVPGYDVVTIDTSLTDWVDYLRLYKAMPDNSMPLVAEGEYRLLDTTRMMRVSGIAPNPINHPDSVYIFPIYETYFDKGYVMNDSFYVSVTNINNIRVDQESHMWYKAITKLMAWWTADCLGLPQHCAFRDPGHDEWVKNTIPYYLFWIWPIIDTTGMNYIAPCDTFFCAGVSDLHVGHPNHVRGGIIDFVWTGAAEHSRWQLSYGPAGTMPGEGTVLDCSTPTVDVYGMQDSVHYVCYVRGYCDMCHKWGDWSEGFEYWKEMYTQPAKIRPGLLDRCITVMPNPASRYVSVMSSFRIGRIEAFDLQGNKVDEQPVDALNATLDLSLWPRGTYILNIRTNRGTVARTVVVQ